MRGAIAGDVIGSRFERPGHATKRKDFALFDGWSRFTDDTVLTVAVAEHLLTGAALAPLLKRYYARYPDAGYGGRFHEWARSPSLAPYRSYGNGSAMRVAPVAWAFEDAEAVVAAAEATARATHDHPEGVKGAVAVALATFLARKGADQAAIRERVARATGYDLARPIDVIRPAYRFDASCQGSVPEAIVAFLDATGYEDAVRNAISLAGDADTQACIAGAIAEARWGGVPEPIWREVAGRLPPAFLAVLDAFDARFGSGLAPTLAD